jgi:hypothetical protein
LLYNTTGDLTYCVIEIMHTVHVASLDNRHIELQGNVMQPTPLPVGLIIGEFDRYHSTWSIRRNAKSG